MNGPPPPNKNYPPSPRSRVHEPVCCCQSGRSLVAITQKLNGWVWRSLYLSRKWYISRRVINIINNYYHDLDWFNFDDGLWGSVSLCMSWQNYQTEIHCQIRYECMGNLQSMVKLVANAWVILNRSMQCECINCQAHLLSNANALSTLSNANALSNRQVWILYIKILKLRSLPRAPVITFFLLSV